MGIVMFKKILIANRGEIACRVISTAKRMGIKTVAIYSDHDENSQHVIAADEAYYVGPSPAKESYLQVQKIIDIALASGSQAIHPGYGFLSENADFAEACAANNIEFIGPPVEAILAMGSKSAAKEIMTKAEVPLVPGYHGSNQNEDFLLKQATDMGYPVLLKAIAGGGGKGMRIVENAEEFPALLTACKREAASSFGNDEVLIEKYLVNPRHVEIQVFADSHGNCVHLFERDCSVQRRHQKVIEEAPAPSIPDNVREQLGAVAIQSAQAIGYVGAGTVEFLYSANDEFFFMEMNTRLQVEHPVTEMITSQDLVEWQLKVAAGEELPLKQDELSVNGHAFEVRIYAEDPNQDFLPATGIVKHLRFPISSTHVRIDSGITEGDNIGIHYDPLIAKLIVWDEDRNSALARLETAIEQCQIAGVTTNLSFLAAIATNKSFKKLDLNTSFIEREQSALFPASIAIDSESVAMAAIFMIQKRKHLSEQISNFSNDPFSPWNQINGWRLNKDNFHPLEFIQKMTNQQQSNVTESELKHQLTVHFRQQGYLVEHHLDDKLVQLSVSAEVTEDGEVNAVIDGHRISCQIVEVNQQLLVYSQGNCFYLSLANNHQDEDEISSDGNLTAPMPGTIISIEVEAGKKVAAGTKLLVLEAMKMEHAIIAPSAGVVDEIFFAVGDQVSEGSQLLQFTSES